MRHIAGASALALLLASCSDPAVEAPRYHPDAPVIEVVSALLEGDGWRFEVGVDGDCLDYRIESDGYAATGGTVCEQASPRQREAEHPQVENHRTSSEHLLVFSYDGCVRAQAVQGIRARDVETTTTICDSRVPPLVFGRIADDIAYACVVAARGPYFAGTAYLFPETNADGVFLYLEGSETPMPAFVLGFTDNGHFRDFEPVDGPFAPALTACEDLAPWADRPGWGES
jgi:hypothetical protein